MSPVVTTIAFVVAVVIITGIDGPVVIAETLRGCCVQVGSILRRSAWPLHSFFSGLIWMARTNREVYMGFAWPLRSLSLTPLVTAIAVVVAHVAQFLVWCAGLEKCHEILVLTFDRCHEAEVPARRSLHGGACTEMCARRNLHGRASTEGPARMCPHGDVCTEVPARRYLRRGACTEASARQ